MTPLHTALYANGTLVGHADLTPLPTAMEAYGGPFHPNEAYEAIRPTVLELMRRAWRRDEAASAAHLGEAYRRHDALDLEVRTPDGEVLHPSAIYIEDAGGVWTDDAPRIELAGLPDAEVQQHFLGEP